MKKLVVLLYLLVSVSCQDKKSTSINDINKVSDIVEQIPDVSDSIKNIMLCKGIDSWLSTSPSYIVIETKDAIPQEICVTSNNLNPNFKRTNHSDTYTIDLDCKSYSRVINNIEDTLIWRNLKILYTEEELEEYYKENNLNSIIKKIQKGEIEYYIFDNSIEQIMFAHIVFNKGIISKRGCWGGNILYFELFNE